MSGNLSRTARRLIDLLVLSAAFWAAGLARFDGDIPLQMFKRLAFAWPYVIGLQYFFLLGFSVPRFSWRHVGLPEARQIFLATGSASTVLLAVRWVAAALIPVFRHAVYGIVPLGVTLVGFPLAFLGVLGVRVLRRSFAERNLDRRPRDANPIPTMLIGAGEGGVAVAKEIRNRQSLGIQPVGFLDDDPDKVGTVVHGVPVVGTTAKLAELCARHGAKQVLVTIARATGRDVRRIVDACEQAELPVKIIPALHEIVGGQLNLSRIRDIAIEDLLRREPVHLDSQGIATFVQKKTVLVTGAGGSIGAEICRQVARYGPKRLVLVERFESALFDIHSELRGVRDVELLPEVADVSDRRRMLRILDEVGPIDVVFHAAAHKHVPMMELCPGEAVKNNIIGTKVLADLAAEHGVGHFVMISTDKAVNPTSVMGASKRVAELYVQGMDQRHDTTFVSVRFGNVLGSSGSVVPVFQKQIARGGPVTVTHPEMTRYFMTIPEATQLVLQAAALGGGGEVFILDMGEPVRIVDLAHDLIRLSGLEPGRDIEIQFTGIRPGEKLFEELATDAEHAEQTRHGKIFIARVQQADWAALQQGIADLAARADSAEPAALYEGLRALLPEFSGKVATPKPLAAVIPLARV